MRPSRQPSVPPGNPESAPDSRRSTADGGERADWSPWRALNEFLEDGEPEPQRLEALLGAAGAPEARLWLERGGREAVLVDGPGGEVEIRAAAAAGRLVLSVPERRARYTALARLIAERLPAGRLQGRFERGGLVGESALLLSALERAAAFADTDLPVLVRGETGTGKELLARHVHALSCRSEEPLLAVNCSALARDLLPSELFGHVRGAFTGADRDRAGVFEAARGGTVFLDEIGDLPSGAQGALLRVLQEGEVRRLGESSPRRVHARVVAATHRDLRSRVRGGRFRQDLFFRLHVATLELPALRLRGDDVLLLARHFLDQLRPGGRSLLTRGARRRLEEHSWPGNVRELKNVLATAAALSGGGIIGERHLELPAEVRESGDGYHARVRGFRRRLIEEALAESGGNRARAARRIGLSRQALSYLVRTLGVGDGKEVSRPADGSSRRPRGGT